MNTLLMAVLHVPLKIVIMTQLVTVKVQVFLRSTNSKRKVTCMDCWSTVDPV